MAYLYHVTTEENAKSILKNGLIPKIGERSQLVGETEKYVYLCGRKDVPFWSLILDKPVVLRVEMKDGEVNENNVYQYSYYSETLTETAIPAERIRKSRVSRSLTDEQMKDLALSYVDMISLICVKFVVNSNPFTIRLKYDTPNGIQDVFAGIDSGRENIGSGASNEDGDCLYLGELKTSNKSIKIKMTERTGFRISLTYIQSCLNHQQILYTTYCLLCLLHVRIP